ncbi:MAG: hypothetical protein KDB68_13760 [Planctomycetes bacterium]|nr:hypothetical protein [Planctomycetota bacterium]
MVDRHNPRLGRNAYLLLMTVGSLALLVAACGNPRANPQPNDAPPANSSSKGPREPRASVTLRPASAQGDRFRTTRTLRVEETTETERYITVSEEVTLTNVLRVDDAGRMLGVRRTWESSVTRLIRGYGQGEEARGELDGCTLDLTQRANGVDAKVVSGDASIRGANFLIEGFDTGLLPLDAVRVSDYWVLEGSRISGLNRFIEAMQFEIDKNKLTCQLTDVDATTARISLDWRISGEFRGTLAVLEFTGELIFDRSARLITSFILKGGRQVERDEAQQIEISIKRRPVDGWLDLDR